MRPNCIGSRTRLSQTLFSSASVFFFLGFHTFPFHSAEGDYVLAAEDPNDTMVGKAFLAAGLVTLLQGGFVTLVGAAKNLPAADKFANVPIPPVSSQIG